MKTKTTTATKKATPSEDLFLQQITDEKLPPPIREHKFLATRRFKFDFAWPNHLFAVEIDGGVWTRGRHVNPIGYTRDCEKFALALLDGWRVLRVTSAQVKSGQALLWTTDWFKREGVVV